jgi:hypothetical protein
MTGEHAAGQLLPQFGLLLLFCALQLVVVVVFTAATNSLARSTKEPALTGGDGEKQSLSFLALCPPMMLFTFTSVCYGIYCRSTYGSYLVSDLVIICIL